MDRQAQEIEALNRRLQEAEREREVNENARVILQSFIDAGKAQVDADGQVHIPDQQPDGFRQPSDQSQQRGRAMPSSFS